MREGWEGVGEDRITTVSAWMTLLLWRFSTVIKNPYYLFYDAVRSPYLFASDMDSMKCVYMYSKIQLLLDPIKHNLESMELGINVPRRCFIAGW
jgi:hypothetical protein